jgi:hypothetical protein
MFFLAVIVALAIGVVVWLLASHWIATYIAWVEDRRPALVGSKQLRAIEAVACGTLFLVCLALASWIARLIWIQVK